MNRKIKNASENPKKKLLFWIKTNNPVGRVHLYVNRRDWA